jgi:hypothetical protein
MPFDAITLPEISSAAWSLQLDSTTASTAPGSGIGSVVQGLDDIDQCIRIICTTVPGEDPFRPTFGADLTQYVDKPLAVALPALVGVVTTAIEQWEPRVKVLSVGGKALLSNPGQLLVTIVWQIDLAIPTGAVPRVIGATPQTTLVLIG